MKLELQIEEQYNRPPWYMVLRDGVLVDAYYDLDKAEALYERIKENPNLAEKTIKVLQSEEIFVTLPEEKT